MLKYISEDTLVRQPSLPSIIDTINTDQEVRDACLQAISDLDPRDLTGKVMKAHQHFGAVDFLDKILSPVMRDVGNQYTAGSMRIAHEHMATAVLRTYLGSVFEHSVPNREAATAVATTLQGDCHELGSLGTAMTAAVEGWPGNLPRT